MIKIKIYEVVFNIICVFQVNTQTTSVSALTYVNYTEQYSSNGRGQVKNGK